MSVHPFVHSFCLSTFASTLGLSISTKYKCITYYHLTWYVFSLWHGLKQGSFTILLEHTKYSCKSWVYNFHHSINPSIWMTINPSVFQLNFASKFCVKFVCFPYKSKLHLYMTPDHLLQFYYYVIVACFFVVFFKKSNDIFPMTFFFLHWLEFCSVVD